MITGAALALVPSGSAAAVELPLSGGDWIRVRSTLTIGEARAMYRRYRAEPGDPFALAVARVLAFVVDWSLVDADGQRVGLRGSERQRLDVLERLDVASFREIADAVAGHEQRLAESARPSDWRETVCTDLAIARLFGWRYEWVAELERDVYTVLLEELAREHRERD